MKINKLILPLFLIFTINYDNTKKKERNINNSVIEINRIKKKDEYFIEIVLKNYFNLNKDNHSENIKLLLNDKKQENVDAIDFYDDGLIYIYLKYKKNQLNDDDIFKIHIKNNKEIYKNEIKIKIINEIIEE